MYTARLSTTLDFHRLSLIGDQAEAGNQPSKFGLYRTIFSPKPVCNLISCCFSISRVAACCTVVRTTMVYSINIGLRFFVLEGLVRMLSQQTRVQYRGTTNGTAITSPFTIF